MLDTLFIQVNQWIVSGTAIAAFGCFVWGMISVLISPCHLASIPLVVSYVAGQDQLLKGKQAAWFAILFSSGLFLSISLVGFTCALLGRMLGDVGPYWTIAVGAILIWISIGILGVGKCSTQSHIINKFQLRGCWGAFILGLAYGLLSGSCTFGFIAPILAIITVQEQILTGSILILFFAAGHCLPIAAAGSSTTVVKQMMLNISTTKGLAYFRQGAGILIGGLGCYFLIQPFV